MQVKMKRAQKWKQKERSESRKKMTAECQEKLKDKSGVQRGMGQLLVPISLATFK